MQQIISMQFELHHKMLNVNFVTENMIERCPKSAEATTCMRTQSNDLVPIRGWRLTGIHNFLTSLTFQLTKFANNFFRIVVFMISYCLILNLSSFEKFNSVFYNLFFLRMQILFFTNIFIMSNAIPCDLLVVRFRPFLNEKQHYLEGTMCAFFL